MSPGARCSHIWERSVASGKSLNTYKTTLKWTLLEGSLHIPWQGPWSLYTLILRHWDVIPWIALGWLVLFQRGTLPVLRCTDRPRLWVPPLPGPHLQGLEAREPPVRPPGLPQGKPGRPRLLLQHVSYIFTFADHRFWVCQAGKRADVDAVWNARVPCTRDHLEQGRRHLAHLLHPEHHSHLEHPDVLLYEGWGGNGGLAASVYRGLAYLARQLSR